MVAERLRVLLPVKELESAKARLAPVLTPHERRALVLAMLADVLEAIRAARMEAWVLSPDPGVLVFAAGHGAVPLPQGPEAASLSQALRSALEQHFPGCEAAMVLLPDTPMVSPEELARLEAAGTSDSSSVVVLAPDRSGYGTNALFLRPAGAIPLRFGPESALLHRAEAASLGIPVRVLRVPGLGLDLDAPADLLAFARARPSEDRLGRRTRALVARLRLEERLAAVRSSW